jgi:hypothetical protein
MAPEDRDKAAARQDDMVIVDALQTYICVF